MKGFFFIFLSIFVFSQAQAESLTSAPRYNYDVAFTNPVCEEYAYGEEVYSRSNQLLEAKPKNVYCKKSDAKASGARETSPQYRLIKWIRQPSTKEIFMTFLSFSKKLVADELCKAVEERDVKLTFIVDRKQNLKHADRLMNCKGKKTGITPTRYLRGHEKGLGWAHNKLLIVNPSSDTQVKISFTSANLSSGIVLHHENWHFVTISPRTYFAQVHLCLRDGMIHHGRTAKAYRAYIKQCRAEIPYEQEEDMKVFLVPGEGKQALNFIQEQLDWAHEVNIAAHRFSYGKLIEALGNFLDQDGILKLVADDDLYWAGRGKTVGPNTRLEAGKVRTLTKKGLKVRYLETNHRQRLIHHNKYMVFKDEEGLAHTVFTGAGNFTGTAFTKNYENFYGITIPHIVKAFQTQYDMKWKKMATAPKDMPKQDIHP